MEPEGDEPAFADGGEEVWNEPAPMGARKSMKDEPREIGENKLFSRES